MRKLMFNKIDHHGEWFREDEDTTGFTEKIPPHTGVAFNEKTRMWENKQNDQGENDNQQ